MRKFTDIFIERPVLATVVSLTLLVLGLRSIGLLPVLQYPRTQNAVVTVTSSNVRSLKTISPAAMHSTASADALELAQVKKPSAPMLMPKTGLMLSPSWPTIWIFISIGRSFRDGWTGGRGSSRILRFHFS